MITDNWQLKQHELIKIALHATDGYLGIEKKAIQAGTATNTMLHDFSYFMSQAHDALQELGVLDQHEEYMAKHVQILTKLHGHDDETIADQPYVHVPKSDYGEVEEEITVTPRSYKALKSFSEFMSEEKKNSDEEISEEEIDKIVDDLTWEDIVDLYDDIELAYEKEDDELEDEDEEELREDFLDEKLSVQSRLKKRQAFARMRGKRNVARNIKLRRASSIEVLKKRANLAARRAVYKRFLRGRDKSTLSAAEKDRVEQQVGRMKYMQQAIAVKMLPKMRSIEQKRLASFRTKKSSAPGGTKPSKAPGGTRRK